MTFFLSRFENHQNDVFIVLSPIWFDPAILVIFEAIMNQSSISIVSKRLTLTPDILSEKLSAQKNLRRLFMTPTLAKTLQKCHNADLKYVLLGGEEPLRHSELIEIFGNKEFFNLYGLTELSIWACLTDIRENETKTPILRLREDKSLQIIFGIKDLVLRKRKIVIQFENSRQTRINENFILEEFETEDFGRLNSQVRFIRKIF